MHSLALVSEPPDINTRGAALIYVQVADHIAARIATGDLAPGSRLPAERSLAAEYGVAYDTIQQVPPTIEDLFIHAVEGQEAHHA